MSDPEPPEPNEFEKYIQKNGFELTTGSYEHEEMDPPEWITNLDREICGILRHGLILTPSVLAKNLDRPRSSISRRLNTLEAGNIIEKVERGHYKMTEEGYARMLQTVTMEELDEEPLDSRTWVVTKMLSPEEAEKIENSRQK